MSVTKKEISARLPELIPFVKNGEEIPLQRLNPLETKVFWKSVSLLKKNHPVFLAIDGHEKSCNLVAHHLLSYQAGVSISPHQKEINFHREIDDLPGSPEFVITSVCPQHPQLIEEVIREWWKAVAETPSGFRAMNLVVIIGNRRLEEILSWETQEKLGELTLFFEGQ